MKPVTICIAFCLATHFWLAQGATVNELDNLVSDFDEKIKEVQSAFEQSVRELNDKYAAAVERQQLTSQEFGRLDEAIALRSEKEAVTSGKAVSTLDDKSTPEAVRRLRKSYRDSYAVLVKTRGSQLKPILSAYAQALDALKLSLTKEGRLDDAKTVANKRSSLDEFSKPQASVLASSSAAVINNNERPRKEEASSEAKAEQKVPKKWAYFQNSDLKLKYGDLTLNDDGSLELRGSGGVTQGKWKQTESNLLEVTLFKDGAQVEAPGKIRINGNDAVWERAIGDRYLKAKS